MDFDVDTFTTTYVKQGVTLTSTNLIRSLVWVGEYPLAVLSKLFKPFMRYHGNNIWLHEQMNKRTRDGWLVRV